MAYSKLNLYLKTNLRTPSKDFVWTKEDNQSFFNFIDENFSEDYLKKEENLLKIKQTFQKYFEPIGYILFQIKNYKIRLKIFEYKIEPKNSENISEIVNIIEKHEDYIIKDYNGKKDQIFIEKWLKDEIFNFVESIKDEKVHKKDLVKFAVREALNLKENDIVVLKEESIFIKLCDVIKKHKVPKDKLNTKLNRYNGINEEELHSFNIEHFSSKEDRNFLKLIAKMFVEKYFLKRKINNQEYEKYVFAYIQAIITEQLMITYDNCEDFFKGLAGYVFRIHFQEVFENIAEAILVEVANSNKYMIEFLKYYSLNIIVVDNKKYAVPVLEAQNGLRWNVVTMLSIVKLYVKTDAMSRLVNKAIDKKEDEITTLYVDELSPVEYTQKIKEEKNSLTAKLIKLEHTVEKYYDSLKFIKDENEKDLLQQQIGTIKEDMQDIKKDRKALLDKAVGRKEINKYITLENEIDSLTRQLKREEKILKQNEESFYSIRDALVKALISKKKQI
jgi:hypothetical protein